MSTDLPILYLVQESVMCTWKILKRWAHSLLILKMYLSQYCTMSAWITKLYQLDHIPNEQHAGPVKNENFVSNVLLKKTSIIWHKQEEMESPCNIFCHYKFQKLYLFTLLYFFGVGFSWQYFLVLWWWLLVQLQVNISN